MKRSFPTITPTPFLRRRDDAVLPLTTIYTPPQSCLDAPFTLQTSSSGVAGFSSAWRDPSQTSANCYPSSYSSLQYNWGWYSPGVCPSGYNIAQSRIVRNGSIGTTLAFCCPASMTISGLSSSGGSNYQYCTSLASDVPVWSYINNAWSIVTASSFSFTAFQWPISVEWALSDLSRFTPASAPVLAATATSTISSLASGANIGSPSTGSPASPPFSFERGLSTGAQVGIGAGIGLAAIAVIVAVILWLLKRRKVRAVGRSRDAKEEPLYVDGKFELATEGAERSPPQPPAELAESGSPLEVHSENKFQVNTANLQTQRSPVELDGNWYGYEADSDGRPGLL